MERIIELETSGAGAVDIITDVLGLEHGKEGGRTKTESPNAR